MTTPYSSQDPKSIQKMFNQIAPSYDKANTVLSAGIHHLWKKTFVKKLGNLKSKKVLDCATGTGDIAFLLEKNGAEVTGIDFSENMLEVARKRAQLLKSGATFLNADVERLPFGEDQFDFVTISFGIRNVKNLNLGLVEISRILKPGGKLFVLEFGQPENQTFAKVYGFYSSIILPALGGMISGKKEAYKYLNQSSSKFPSGSAFCEIAKNSGAFKTCKFEPLSLGIAYIYTLEK